MKKIIVILFTGIQFLNMFAMDFDYYGDPEWLPESPQIADEPVVKDRAALPDSPIPQATYVQPLQNRKYSHTPLHIYASDPALQAPELHEYASEIAPVFANEKFPPEITLTAGRIIAYLLARGIIAQDPASDKASRQEMQLLLPCQSPKRQLEPVASRPHIGEATVLASGTIQPTGRPGCEQRAKRSLETNSRQLLVPQGTLTSLVEHDCEIETTPDKSPVCVLGYAFPGQYCQQPTQIPNAINESQAMGLVQARYGCTCPFCRQFFTTSSHMRRHIARGHKGEKPTMALCPVPNCGYVCPRHDHIGRHKKTSTGILALVKTNQEKESIRICISKSDG